MALFLTLTLAQREHDTRYVDVNMDHVAVISRREGWTHLVLIYTQELRALDVQETPEEIRRLIRQEQQSS